MRGRENESGERINYCSEKNRKIEIAEREVEEEEEEGTFLKKNVRIE